MPAHVNRRIGSVISEYSSYYLGGSKLITIAVLVTTLWRQIVPHLDI